MSLTRYGRFNRRSDSLFPFGKSVPVPVPTVDEAQRIDKVVLDSKKADGRSAQFAGEDTTFARFAVLNPVRFDPGLTTAAVLQFTVPPGRVLVVERVQIGLSEPMLYTNGQFGWRLTVNRGQLPFHDSQGLTSGRTDVLGIPFGGIEPDSWISPLYVQANATVAVDLSEIQMPDPPNSFNEYLVAWCWLYGTLKKTTGVS